MPLTCQLRLCIPPLALPSLLSISLISLCNVKCIGISESWTRDLVKPKTKCAVLAGKSLCKSSFHSCINVSNVFLCSYQPLSSQSPSENQLPNPFIHSVILIDVIPWPRRCIYHHNREHNPRIWKRDQSIPNYSLADTLVITYGIKYQALSVPGSQQVLGFSTPKSLLVICPLGWNPAEKFAEAVRPRVGNLQRGDCFAARRGAKWRRLEKRRDIVV